jgi:hypothetical protein
VKIAVYRIRKNQFAIKASTGSLPLAPPSLLPKWNVPSDWKGPLSEMRVATCRTEGASCRSADISTPPLPGR